MRRIVMISLFMFFLICNFWFAKDIDLSKCHPKSFVVTWYYSPKQWQKFYYRWSFEADKKLNWNWIRWASWKQVFNGMLAWPKSYSFGTKIFFPWYGVWEISDRGWAIVKAGVRWSEYDRIDIWMWSWELWLMRALTFGKKTMTAYVCDNDISVWFEMWNFQIYKDFYEVTMWWVNMDQWRKDGWVKILQTYLNKLWYLDKNDITWFFWQKTRKALCSFQVDRSLIQKTHELCWYFGSKTSSSLKQYLISKKKLSANIFASKMINSSKQSIRLAINERWDLEVKKNSNLFVLYRSYNKWEESSEVIYLQKYLKQLWYFDNKPNWKYDKNTADAVYEFQIKYGILKWDEDMSVKWFLWPKTRKVLNDMISQMAKIGGTDA